MSNKIEYSKHFKRNLNSSEMQKQIKKNLWICSEIWKDESNQIAPVDKGDLRQNTSARFLTDDSVENTWNQSYSGIRNESNKKNPQTTHFVEKGYKKAKNKIKKNIGNEVFK